jgi:hypothetical protein
MMTAFWRRVRRCKHKRESPNYHSHQYCGNEEVGCAGGLEWHCLDCGAYITDDPCQVTKGMSGWPAKRWRHGKVIDPSEGEE